MFKRKRQVKGFIIVSSLLFVFSACSSKDSSDIAVKNVSTSMEELTGTLEPQSASEVGRNPQVTVEPEPPMMQDSQVTADSEISVVQDPQVSAESQIEVFQEKFTELKPQSVSEAGGNPQVTAEPETSVVQAPQIPVEPEPPVKQEPQITGLDVTMYAAAAVNVREGDNKNTALVGSLAMGQEVSVTGQSVDTGWYRIDYNGQEGFVSNNYLQNDRPVVQASGVQQDIETQNEQLTVKPGSAQQILNSAPLNPSLSGYEPLDTLLGDLLPQLYPEGADTYEKVKACYDYLIQNCSYTSKGGSGVPKAYEMLVSHEGDCSDYSVAFDVMMKHIGLDSKVIALGQTTKTDGSYTPHWWCVITIDGIEYVFDAQIEDNIAKGGAIKYYRFCKRYDEVPGKYIVGEVYDYYPYEEENVWYMYIY